MHEKETFILNEKSLSTEPQIEFKCGKYIRLLTHASDRRIEREISIDDIVKTIKYPDFTFPNANYSNGKTYKSTINGNTVKIGAVTIGDTTYIITVM